MKVAMLWLAIAAAASPGCGEEGKGYRDVQVKGIDILFDLAEKIDEDILVDRWRFRVLSQVP